MITLEKITDQNWLDVFLAEVDKAKLQTEKETPARSFVMQQLGMLISKYNLKECQDHKVLTNLSVVQNNLVRYEWECADALWRGSISSGENQVLITLALFSKDTHPWLSLNLKGGDHNYNFTGANATTSHWNGEMAGSAIKREPDSLRGNLWRTGTKKDRDLHVLPEDVIEFLMK